MTAKLNEPRANGDQVANRPGPSADESELIKRAQAGDAEAFNELADRHGSMVRRVLFRILKDCEQAWDAMQEALLGAWRNIGKFEGRAKFSTWLTRIGINEAYRGRRRSGPEVVGLEDSIGERVPDWGNRPDETFESREFLGAVGTALDSLSPDYRTAVVLRDLEGLSTRDAAASAGIEERAFKSRLHRGRMALRAELDEYFSAGYVR
ncbi:MAG: sigma-70 family RNA polymerase sigma factor [Solirubrobacterales bacterium]